MEIRALRGLLAAVPVLCLSAQTGIDLRTQSRNVDFSQAASTRTSKTGTIIPAVCTVGETFFLTTAPGGSNLYGCTAANVWTLLSSTPPITGEANKVLSNDGGIMRWVPLGGDSTGTPETLKVTGIQGRAVSSSAPSEGQCLSWSASSSRWEPSDCGTGAGAFSTSFPSLTTWNLAGSAHGLGTCDVQVIAMAPLMSKWEPIESDKRTCESAAGPNQYDIVVNFATPQAGRLLVIKGGGGGGGAGAQSTASNVGTGCVGVFKQQVGTTLEFKNVNGASNRLSVVNDVMNNEIDIDVVQANLSLSSIGGLLAGSQIAAGDKTGNGARIATSTGTLINGNCVKIDANGNLVDHGSACGGGSGTASTASNVGTGGVGVFKQQVGTTLEFKNVNGASNRLSVVNDPVNNEIDIDVVQANLSLSSIGGLLAGSQIAAGDKTGNGARLATSTGTLTNGNCVKIDANGNLVDHGSACGGGSGGVPAGSDNSLQYRLNASTFGAVANNTTATRMFVFQETSGTPALAAIRPADVPSVFPGMLEGAFAHDFPSIANGACMQQTFTLTGAVAGTAATVGASHPAGIQQTAEVSGMDTVVVKVCNHSGNAYDPATLTFNIVLLGSQYR